MGGGSRSLVRARTFVVTGSASLLGQRTTRRLSAAGVRVITVDAVEADILAELNAPSGRSAMVSGVAQWVGGVVDGVVATAVADPGSPVSVQGTYFAPVAAIGGLRRLLAGSGSPRAIAVTAAPASPPPDDTLVEACLSGDEGLAIELADRLGACAPARVGSSAATALQEWLQRHSRTREWAGRGIPLVGVGAAGAHLDVEAEEDLAAFVTELCTAPVLPMSGALLVPNTVHPGTATAGTS